MVNNILDLIRKLCDLYNIGIIEDLVIVKGGCEGIYLSESSTDEIVNAVANCGYDSFAVKYPGKMRYEMAIYLPSISSYKVNRKSIVLKIVHLSVITGLIEHSDIKIRW